MFEGSMRWIIDLNEMRKLTERANSVFVCALFISTLKDLYSLLYMRKLSDSQRNYTSLGRIIRLLN